MDNLMVARIFSIKEGKVELVMNKTSPAGTGEELASAWEGRAGCLFYIRHPALVTAMPQRLDGMYYIDINSRKGIWQLNAQSE